MDDFNFEYDFSLLDFAALHQADRITPQEITSVFENMKKVDDEFSEPFIGIGYSKQKRVLVIAFLYSDEKVKFVSAKVANENEIDNFYCGF